MLNTHNIYRNGTMETYDDRPISMYDNLNNMTTTTASAPTNTSAVNTSNSTSNDKITTMANSRVTVLPTTSSSKTNGEIYSTPFNDITFKFNDNSDIRQQKQEQKDNNQQQLELNGNRNLNEITPNTGNPTTTTAAIYAAPNKTLASIKPVEKASTALSTPPLIVQQQQPEQQHSPILVKTTATTANILTSSSSLLHTNTITTVAAIPTAALNSDTLNCLNRPLSQHSESELNDTSNSIAAVKAALNEAKSKFFGLDGNASTISTPSTSTQHNQQDQQHNYDVVNNKESQNNQLLPIEKPKQQQVQNLKKPQPKYQNIPENSAIFRNQTAAAAGSGAPSPELPPKPVEYQSLQQPSKRNLQTISAADHQRKMTSGTSYNQISLHDIDGSASRSQTVYMSTTVPQNIKGNKIAGRHTPTRSSLRHSRMLVVNNKNYAEVQHPNPMGFQQPNLARWLLILQIIVGVLLLSLSIWIFFLTPNAPIQENPYWCCLVLLITGIIGLIVVRYQRIKRAKTREHCFMFLRMGSYVLSLLSVLLCCVALIFAAIHYCRLTAADTKCKSMHALVEHGSCICTFNAPPMANTTEPLLGESNEEDNNTNDNATDNSYKVEYRDLSCQEVTGPWTSILGLSFILNCLGFVISFMYIILLAYCRKSSKRLYTTVRTSTF